MILMECTWSQGRNRANIASGSVQNSRSLIGGLVIERKQDEGSPPLDLAGLDGRWASYWPKPRRVSPSGMLEPPLVNWKAGRM